MKTKKISLGLFTALAISSAMYANDSLEIQDLKKEIQELRDITQTLIDETSDLKTGFNYTTVDVSKSHSGLGSAASKVYYSKSPLSIGGYGEMYFANEVKNTGSAKSTLDVYRFVPYIGYKFTDNIILNVELEFEHGGVANNGGTSEGGEVIVEFMYLDFLLNPHANIRVGNFLVPMGLINERHEPTLFTTVQRPNTSKLILPSTWHESGLMVYGNIVDNLSYKFAALSALQTGVNGEKWLRDARGGSFKQTDAALGFVARLDYTGINGLFIGASSYYAPSVNGTDSTTNINDVHLDYKNSGIRVYGTYAFANRSNASDIATNAVESAKGGYVNLSYDLLSRTSSKNSLPIFVQFESVNPEDKKADTTSGDSIDTTTLGINYFPHEQVVLKLDYTLYAKGLSESDTTSVSMGFIF
ncbi:OprO/OprP family phosphate-selective porin [bacterium]|nr:OprO/OprP family phosphate-selective porin [bacterium]MBU1994012.1 OprO/OprP family phosphate-selective porin [bacterium]